MKKSLEERQAQFRERMRQPVPPPTEEFLVVMDYESFFKVLNVDDRHISSAVLTKQNERRAFRQGCKLRYNRDYYVKKTGR